ncbi:MAG TPA: phage terminase small subunit P27 family [Nonomuraea sp.]|nr:phage terminase small subunit P27 family [Nonomuraea sp.]
MAIGKQGGHKKPRALAAVEGDRPDRINFDEPVPADGEVRAPDRLSDEARAVWDRIAPDLVARKVLTPWDVDSFATFCDAVARHRRAAARLDADGEVVEGHRGVAAKNPWWQIWRDAADVMVKMGSRFGLNPADRTQLSVGGDEGDDEKSPARYLS